MQACRRLQKAHRGGSIQNHIIGPADGRVNRDWKVTAYIDLLKRDTGLNNNNDRDEGSKYLESLYRSSLPMLFS